MATSLTRRAECSAVDLPTLTLPKTASAFVRLDSPDNSRSKESPCSCVRRLVMPLDDIVRTRVKLNLDVMLLGGLYLFSAFFALAFFFQRHRWRQRKRRGKSNWGFYPSSASLGNALQRLSVMAQPQVQHAVEEKVNEDAEDDSEGRPENPVAHLHKQAARIRRGEKLDRLTARCR
jgi:hypothetical protein